MNCPECKGKGEIALFVSVRPCEACKGTGRVSEVQRAVGRAQRPGQAVPTIQTATGGIRRNPGESDQDFRDRVRSMYTARLYSIPVPSFRSMIPPDHFQCRSTFIPAGVVDPGPTPDKVEVVTHLRGAVIPKKDIEAAQKRGLEEERERRVERIRAEILRDMAMCIPSLDTSPHSVVSIMAGTSARQLAMLEERLERLEAEQ